MGCYERNAVIAAFHFVNHRWVAVGGASHTTTWRRRQ